MKAKGLRFHPLRIGRAGVRGEYGNQPTTDMDSTQFETYQAPKVDVIDLDVEKRLLDSSNPDGKITDPTYGGGD